MKYVLYVLLQATIKDVFISQCVFILSRLLIVMAVNICLQVFFLQKIKEKENDIMDLTNLKYIQVPMVVLLDEDLSSTTKLLMGLITTLSMKDGYCYASNRYLSNLLKVSKRTISSSITTLRRNNYLKIDNDDSARKIYLANIF